MGVYVTADSAVAAATAYHWISCLLSRKTKTFSNRLQLQRDDDDDKKHFRTMQETGIPSLASRQKRSAIPVNTNAANSTSHLVASRIPKSSTLSAASSSAINVAAMNKTSHASKIGTTAKPGSILAAASKVHSVESAIQPPKSSTLALRPKTATSSVPKPTPASKLPALEGKSRLAHRQSIVSKASTPAATPNVSDMNKSLTLAQEMITIQKEREAQLGSQLESLRNDRVDLEQSKNKLQETVSSLEKSSHAMALKINELEHAAALAEGRQNHENELRLRDLVHEHETTIARLRSEWNDELNVSIEKVRAEANDMVEQKRQIFEQALAEKEAMYSEKLDHERTANAITVQNLKELQNQKEASFNWEKEQAQKELERVQEEKAALELQIESMKAETNTIKSNLSKYQSETEDNFYTYQVQVRDLEREVKAKNATIASLESDLKTAKFERSVATEKLFQAETIRRRLHAQIQELKGNIRVFCRVRPVLRDETSPVDLHFPDMDDEGQKLQLMTPTVLNGMPSDSDSTSRIHNFTFDKVFSPQSTNEQVFEEVSQLVQSALDGYNVCIFAYGQTGSGKTYSMSSPTNGIIPLALNQIFESAERLKEVGWAYTYHGEFLEIYNEKINDLLKTEDVGDKKYEIRHDAAKCSTTVVGLTSVPLNNTEQAIAVLERASRNRSVAATMANERSSRSHSVFILRFTGKNSKTGKSCSGVLNLIDLAGSERLSHSQVTGDRLKETQAINKSLSSLGDVIGALGGKKDAHIPYRNSKVSFLQNVFFMVDTNKISSSRIFCSTRYLATRKRSCWSTFRHSKHMPTKPSTRSVLQPRCVLFNPSYPCKC